MDPLSITASVIGISHIAISSIDHLRGFVNSLAEAKEVVQDIASTLEAIRRPLDALRQIKFSDDATYTAAKEDLKNNGVAEAVNACGKACDEFAAKLQRWTKHSNSKKMSLRDRLSIGVLNKESIHTFRTRIQSCQSIVQFAITSTQL
jgi:hypothetical protein